MSYLAFVSMYLSVSETSNLLVPQEETTLLSH